MGHVFLCNGHDLKLPGIKSAKGLELIDANNDTYLDFESGTWSASLGHNHETVTAAMKDQVDRIVHSGFCYNSPVVDQAAASLLKTADFGKGQAMFLCSGSEGIEVGCQISRHLTGKSRAMTLHDSYLGAYSSMKDREKGWFLFDWTDCAVCSEKEFCNDECYKIQQIPDDISQFIFEPGSSSGFVRFPPKGLIPKLVRTIRKTGGFVIANEVTTAIGRTGKWYGYQHYNIAPDMIAVGKGVGNGYPVSALLISASVLKQLEINPFKYAQSHQNDPLGARVVKTVLGVILQEKLIDHAEHMGQLLAQRLAGLVDGEIITGFRSRGLMAALDFQDPDMCSRVYDGLVKEGYIVANRGTGLRIDPPLIVTADQIQGLEVAFKRVIKTMANYSNELK